MTRIIWKPKYGKNYLHLYSVYVPKNEKNMKLNWSSTLCDNHSHFRTELHKTKLELHNKVVLECPEETYQSSYLLLVNCRKFPN